MTALDAIDYRGYLTFEYFHPFEHWPEALIYQTSAVLDLMLAVPRDGRMRAGQIRPAAQP